MVGGDVDLRAHPRTGAAQARDLERRDRHVRDGGARLKAARDRDDRHAVGARQLGDLAAARDDDAARAERARGLVAGERLLGVARVRGAEDRRVGRRPRRQPVLAGGQDRARRVVAEHRARQHATDARAAHPGDDQPAGRVPRRQLRGLDLPLRVAQVLGQADDVGEQVGLVDRRDRLGIQALLRHFRRRGRHRVPPCRGTHERHVRPRCRRRSSHSRRSSRHRRPGCGRR